VCATATAHTTSEGKERFFSLSLRRKIAGLRAATCTLGELKKKIFFPQRTCVHATEAAAAALLGKLQRPVE